MRFIKLIYWHTTINNYGDLLSPYIIGKLSGKQIVHKNYFVGNWKSHLYHFVKSIIKGDWRLKCDYQFPFENTIIGIGSILFSGNKKSKIWGAGFMSDSERCKGGTIYALRGRLSLSKIRSQIELGDKISLVDNFAIGDPAMLIPLIISPNPIKKYTIGIIPHFSEMDYFRTHWGDKFRIIDLRDSNVEKITLEITSCQYVVSSSLHGIIVAHSYGIPALWIEHSGLEKNTQGFKFKDYLSSVNIPYYTPITDLSKLLDSEENVKDFFKVYEDVCLPKVNILEIQNNLIKVAPFNVKRRI